MTNLEEAREYIAKKAEADGELIFAREVRAGCWDHRPDVQRVLKRFSSVVANWEDIGEDELVDLVVLFALRAAKMREAGCNLAEAAARVVRDYDGLHRLNIAISAWFSAIANEGDRDERHTASADTRPNVHQSTRSGSEPNKPLPSD